MMLTVHHLNNSRSHRLLVLLEELELPYEVKIYQREKTGLAPDALRRVHPLGKAPILTDGDRVLVETGAIVEYVLRTYGEGRLQPAPGAGLAEDRYGQFMHYAEGSLMPLLVMSLVLSSASAQGPRLAKPLVGAVSNGVHKVFITPQTRLQLGYLDGELARRPWFAGDMFTAADIMMSFPLEAAHFRKLLTHAPNLTDWVARFTSRPSYARAIARGGKQDFLMA